MDSYKILPYETKVHSESNGEVSSYGFTAMCGDHCVSYPDITTDKSRLEEFIAILAQEKPDVKILPELIEDFLI